MFLSIYLSLSSLLFSHQVRNNYVTYILALEETQFRKCQMLIELRDYAIGILTVIKITCPCNVDPITTRLYIVELGFTRVYIFLIFAQNIDCAYRLEPPIEAVLTCTHNL